MVSTMSRPPYLR